MTDFKQDISRVSSKTLVLQNPKLTTLGLRELAFHRFDDNSQEGVFFGLFGNSFLGPHWISEVRFKDSGDAMRVSSITRIPDLPLTFKDGVKELQRRAAA